MTHKKIKIEDSLEPYFRFYNEENEYFLKFPDGKEVPTMINTWNILYPKAKIRVFPNSDKGAHQIVVPKKVLDSISPDNIDNQTFWKIVSDKYKCFSVAGGPATIKTPQDANIATFNFANRVGAIKYLTEQFQKKPDSKMLEIGFGYGNVASYVYQNFKDVNYYGIDVIDRVIVLKNLFETDGWEIPKEIPKNLDIVYSMNVFQHLSQKQRWNYFEKAKKLLKRGGLMVFSSYIMNDDNKDEECWGVVDYHGRGYCHFFNQPTEVDFEYELLDKFNELNFEIVEYKVNFKNFLFCVIKKK